MTDLVTSLRSARRHPLRAMQRGDLDAAIRWTMVMRYQLDMAKPATARIHNRPRPKRPRPKS
jgi:hypothetical protein